MSLKIINLMLQLHLPGANEVIYATIDSNPTKCFSDLINSVPQNFHRNIASLSSDKWPGKELEWLCILLSNRKM